MDRQTAFQLYIVDEANLVDNNLNFCFIDLKSVKAARNSKLFAAGY